MTVATAIGMEPLVEVFDAIAELDVALDFSAEPRIIGVNNRNLKTSDYIVGRCSLNWRSQHTG